MALQIEETEPQPLIGGELLSVDTFGKFLARARQNTGLGQEAITQGINEFLAANNRTQIGWQAYSWLERDNRYPNFDEIGPIYQILSQLSPYPFSLQIRKHYIALAAKRFSQRKRKQRGRFEPTLKDWGTLLEDLTAFDRQIERLHAQKAQIHTLPPSNMPQICLSGQTQRILNANTSFVIGREPFVQEMLLQWSEGKRIFVTKGMAGAGKTKTMYLLLQRIGVMEYKWPMYYSFPPSDKTSIDQLDTFLSQLYTDLQLPPLEEEHVSRDAMIENILVEMKRCSEYGVGIAILLDDLQTILDQEGDLPEPWQEFLDAFVQYKHSAVIYIATREWPQWHGPNWSFLKVEDLPKLSADDGIAIWKRCGFDDVYD